MPIYDRTARDLLHEFARETLDESSIFSKQEAVLWFEKRYPLLNKNTISMHVEAMCVNSRQRRHHPNVRAGLGWDLFYKIDSKQFRLWKAATDPQPIYKADLEAASSNTEDWPLQVSSQDQEEESDSSGNSFAFERDLQNYLVKNLNALEKGLTLYRDDDGAFDGVEFPVGGRRIDILGVGSDGALVVIETKVSKAYDRVIGQTMRYMGWIKKNLANDKPVRGIIVANAISEDLVLATALQPDIRLVEYEIAFSLKQID